MKSVVVAKHEIQNLLAEYIAGVGVDNLIIEFDETSFVARPFDETSILDVLSANADDLGTEDMSINVDHYLYGHPKRK